MLTLGEIIRAPKTGVKVGAWKTGDVPASSFPIAKQKRLKLNSAWSWRVVEFEALGIRCRILIRLNKEISYYSSILAVEKPGLNQIICHHEFHLSHRNWHCHFVGGNVLDAMPGVLRDRERMRVYDSEPSKAGSVEFNIDSFCALEVAARRFRFDAPGERPRQGGLFQ